MEIPPVKKLYKVTIEEITTTHFETEERIKVESRHYTDKELEESHHYIRDRQDPESYKKDIYGSRPGLATKTDEVKVYQQIVSILDLSEVIMSVLGK